MLDFLPSRLMRAVEHVNLHRLYELRVRADKPLRANIGGREVYLGVHGETASADDALYPTAEELSDIVFAASEYSVYAASEQIKRGYVTAAHGERIGLAGTYVSDRDGTLTIRSYTSLCIRVPHAVQGCAEEIYTRCLRDGMRSLLLMAPPGEGKTTLLRDLSRLICLHRRLNVLVCDERGELSADRLGDTADIIRFSDKLTAFPAGIRAMRPDVVVTDELLPEDYAAVRRAIESGICVLASAHLIRVEDVPQKLFSRYIRLDGLGKIGAIMEADGNVVD